MATAPPPGSSSGARIPVTCHACEKTMRVKAERAGKRVQCKSCGEVVKVPGGKAGKKAAKKRKARAAESDAPRGKASKTGKNAPQQKGAKPGKGRRGSSSEAGKRAAPRGKRGRRGDDPSDSGARRAGRESGGKDQQLLFAGVAVAVGLLLLAGGWVLLSGSPSSPPAEDAAVAAGDPVASEGPGATATATPDPRADQPTQSEFPNGAPTSLPQDDREALELIARYEAAFPQDAKGLLRLYVKVRRRFPDSAGVARRIDMRLDQLREQRAQAVGEEYDAFARRAHEALGQEDYATAKAVWTEAQADLADEAGEAIREELAKVKLWEGLSQELRQGLSEAGQPGRRADAALLERLGRLLAKTHDVRETPTFAQVRARAQAERTLLRAARRERAQARLEEARAQLATREEKRVAALAERSEVARKVSKKRPIKFAGKAQVKVIERDSFVLVSQQGAAETSFRYVQRPELTAEVLERGCRPKQPEDLVDLVMFCLRHRLFAPAERAAKKLLKLSPSHREQIPDIAAMRRASRPFRGDPLGDDAHAGAVYRFTQTDAQLLLPDWTPVEGTQLSVDPRGGLTMAAKDAPAARFKLVSFAGPVTIDIAWPRFGTVDGIVIVHLDVEGTRGTRLGAYLSRQGGAMLLATQGTRLDPVSEWIGRDGRTARLTIGNGRARLEAGGGTAETTVPKFSTVEVILSCPTSDAGRASLAWPEFSISGRLWGPWLRKSIAAYSDLLRRETTRIDWGEAPAEQKKEKKDGKDEPKIPPVPFQGIPSVDDAFALAPLDSEARARYRRAWDLLRAGDLDTAHVIFDEAVRAQARHPGAFYGRGLGYFARERYENAFADVELAVELDAGFAEALTTRGHLRRLFGQAGAAEDLEQALELAPDLVPAYREHGQLALEAGDFARAAADLGVAMVLDPQDLETRRQFLSVRQVAQGPAWEEIFRHETQHFRVETDISAARAEAIGKLLEAGRQAYAKVVGKPEPGQEPQRKAVCLVFDSDLAFVDYATAVGFGEHDARTLGLYTPRYKQLLFYEDKNDVDGQALRIVAQHEGFHRYADELMPGCPTWANEGLAELFAGELVSRDGLLEGRLSDLELGLKERKIPPVEELMRMTQRQFYGPNKPYHYAAGWALCRYLVRGLPGTSGPAQAFRGFLQRLRQRERPAKAFQEAFAEVDLVKLDRDWRAYVKTMRK